MRHRTLNVRDFAQAPAVDDQFVIDSHVVEQHGAAGGGALAKAGPVIDNAQAGSTAANKGHDRFAVVVERLDCDPVREQCTGGVKLLTADNQVILVSGNACLQVEGIFTTALRPCITNAPALQHAAEQLFFLRRGRGARNQIENAHLVLRNLPQRRVGSRDNGKHFSQGDERYLWPAELAGNGNTA